MSEFYFLYAGSGKLLAGDSVLDEALKNYCDVVDGRIEDQAGNIVYGGNHDDEVQG